MVTKLRHIRDTTSVCSKQGRQCNAMPPYRILQARQTHSRKERRTKRNKQEKNTENENKSNRKTTVHRVVHFGFTRPRRKERLFEQARPTFLRTTLLIVLKQIPGTPVKISYVDLLILVYFLSPGGLVQVKLKLNIDCY